MSDKTSASPPSLQEPSASLKPATSSSSTTSKSHRESLSINSRGPPSPHLGSVNRSSSLAENFRHIPLSPRTQRAPSMSQAAIQDLINNPPNSKPSDPAFVGRDWRTVRVEEIIDSSLVRFVELTTSVEKATDLLISSGSPNVVLLRETPKSQNVVGTFDYSDLNAYLLLVVGLSQPKEDQIDRFKELAAKGREGKPIPIKDVKDLELGRNEPLVLISKSEPLTQAVEIFGSGIHRVIVVDESTKVVGVLTQLRLVEFFGQNHGSFFHIESLFASTLKDLELGEHKVFAINGDKPLTAALEIIYNEGITSLPVLDSQQNVVGNISHVDVRLLTKSSSRDLLLGSCLHFISIILSERGMDDGKDSYPVFYVNPFSTLAHTVAKLVATRSHRMWVVESPSPASSGPPTPHLAPASAILPTSNSAFQAPPPSLSASSPQLTQSVPPPVGLPYTPTAPPGTTVTANTLAGASLSGRLTGVVSLTDILNLFAKASGLNPIDPSEVRRQRRRSSSASLGLRRSMESSRSASASESGQPGDDSSRRTSLGRRPQ